MAGTSHWVKTVIVGAMALALALVVGVVRVNTASAPPPLAGASQTSVQPPEGPLRPQPEHHPAEVAPILAERNTPAAASAGTRLALWREVRLGLERIEAGVPAFVAVDNAIEAASATNRAPHRVDLEGELHRERVAMRALSGDASPELQGLLERIRAELDP